ncbi:MAG: helix-turn-helix domain-containing protein [Candidatus Adiutrix sp.]|jgi:DNA-binding transcriptional ArsR family regulator|nr:helix-turn-helix domain-containing protein [Candidatus Adiutrix sp.]
MRREIAPDIISKWGAAAPILEALGSVTRQRILLLFEPGEQINIKNVAEQFNLSRTAVVHHISVLQEAGILKGERVGKEVIMYVDWNVITQALGRVISLIDEEYGTD